MKEALRSLDDLANVDVKEFTTKEYIAQNGKSWDELLQRHNQRTQPRSNHGIYTYPKGMAETNAPSLMYPHTYMTIQSNDERQILKAEYKLYNNTSTPTDANNHAYINNTNKSLVQHFNLLTQTPNATISLALNHNMINERVEIGVLTQPTDTAFPPEEALMQHVLENVTKPRDVPEAIRTIDDVINYLPPKQLT